MNSPKSLNSKATKLQKPLKATKLQKPLKAPPSPKALSCQWVLLPKKVRVGDFLHLQCQGESLKNLSFPLQAPFQFQLPEEQKYQLVLLRPLAFDKKQLLLEVTSYKVGHHSLAQLQLHHGQKNWVLSPLQLQVTSVLKAGQKVKPYSFHGPFHLPWPWELIFLFSGICFAFLALFIFRTIKKIQRRHWKQNMKVYDSNLSPAHELGKSLRHLQARFSLLFSPTNTNKKASISSTIHEEILLKGERKTLFVEELNKILRKFLLRTLEIPPILYWKERKVQQEIKSHFLKKKKQVSTYDSLHLLIAEIKKIETPQVNTISLNEARLICHLLHKTAYEVERTLQ